MSTTVSYKGNTLATVENETKTLLTSGTWLEDNITLVDDSTNALQSKSVTYTPTESSQTGTITADSGYDGLSDVSVTVNAVSPTYVGSGVTRQTAQTIHPSTSAQTIESNKYLTGTQTIEAVTLTNLTAENIVNGVTVKVGSATDDDCVISVTGTASSGSGMTITDETNNTGTTCVIEGTNDNPIIDDYELSETALGSDGTVDLSAVITSLTTYANETTGASDTDLSSAVATLVAGYGGGGGYSIDDFADGTVPSGAITINTSSILEHAFYGRTAITSLIAPNCTALGGNAFSNCTGLTYLYIGGTDATFGNYAVRYCSALEEIHIPYAKSSFGFGGYGLQGCTSLRLIDYGNVNTAAFNSLSTCPLDTIILRKDGVVTLTANSLNNSTAFCDGGTGGTVYVPSAYVETYKTSGNWATYYGYGTMTFAAIEGSQYEL